MTADLLPDDSLHNHLLATVGPDVASAVVTEFRRGWEVEKVLAEQRQRRIAQASHRLGRHTVEGLGQLTHSVDLFAWVYWNARTKGQGWKHREFWDEFGRDNPGTRVPYAPRKTTVMNLKTWLDRDKPKPLILTAA